MLTPIRVCFVCTGNICRSPTAEVVLTRLVYEAGLQEHIVVDSAGVAGWHIGDDMDTRSRSTMQSAGYEVPLHSAKQFTAADLASRDYVLALDGGHLTSLLDMAAQVLPGATVTGVANGLPVITRLGSYDLSAGHDVDVADPYYGTQRDFDAVLAQIERACAQLLTELRPAINDGTAS